MTGAILAGGRSRRMGANKALIKINDETIIQRTVRIFKDIFNETIIIANEPLLYQGLSTRVCADIHKDTGSIGGIYTALSLSKGGHVFVAACDMPFLDKNAIQKVIDHPAGDAVIPFIQGRFHPMHALYSKSCMKQIETLIKEKDLRLSSLIERIHVKKLTEHDFPGIDIAASVENINTKEELERIRGNRQ